MARTQKERREGTIAALLQATIDCIIEYGYASTTTPKICKAAGVTTGALFRYYPTRAALMAAVAEEIGARHLQQFGQLLTARPKGDLCEVIVRFCHAATREPTSMAWHAILVAARTDPALRAATREPLLRFENAVVEMAPLIVDGPPRDANRLATFVLTILHCFDSEAVTVPILHTPRIEDERVRWFIETFRSELEWQRNG